MANINLNTENMTPFLYALLGMLSLAGLVGYLNFGKASSTFTRVVETCLSSIGVHRSSTGAQDGEEFENDEHLVLDKYQIESLYGPETWQRKSYEDLCTVLLSSEYGMKTFPCTYATKGYKSNDQRYVFIPTDNPSEPRNVRRVAAALRKYLKLSHSCGPNTTLVVLCPPSEPIKSVEQYNLDFWSFLHGLRVVDKKPWPEDIPADTQTNKWAFCFDGVPWFPAVLTPAHSRRQSRYTPNVVYVMQPKWIFDILFSTPAKRYGACEKVRKLVTEFDDVPLSPDVAHYGEPGTTESRQYYLLDQNERSFCPYPHLL